jgi:tetratricopeptide (TPR) repeat protein
MKTNRALLLARDAYTRRFYLSDANTEIEYVISRADKDFVLLPEMLTRKGENLVHLGQGPVAVLEFERAIEVKKDYWPAYAQLSDFYRASGDIKMAREVLESGLEHAPDAKGLQRRLSELDAASPRAGAKR